MVDVRRVYKMGHEPVLLREEVYHGTLVYRVKGTFRRISYDQLKKGLIKGALR